MDARKTALDLLREWEKGNTFADELLSGVLRRFASASPHDRALSTELFYGVLRQRSLLDWAIEQVADRKPRRSARQLLELGLYQLLFLNRVPAYAAVSETTRLARAECSKSEAGFVNAVLRRATDERAAILQAAEKLRDTNPPTYHSHPKWLFDRWESRWGRAAAQSLCEWNNAPPPVILRVNQLKTSAQELAAILERESVPFERHSFAVNCFIVSGVAAEAIPGFAKGFFYVQDPGTLLAVDMLDPQSDDIVLDACAAPGGKTCYIAEKMRNRGRIVACDASAKRLRLVRENCARLGVTIAQTKVFDWNAPNAERQTAEILRCAQNDKAGMIKWFDRALVDVPCSNTGVMRRRVDVRWRLSADDIKKLASQQLQILRSSSQMVRAGGCLVYSTCSLEQEENQDVVEAFLNVEPAFRLVEKRETFPPRDKVDGAFAAKFLKQMAS